MSQPSRLSASQAVVEEVFLSPRVVDHDAFLAFSRRLRELVTESDEARAALATAAEEARHAHEALRREWTGHGEQWRRLEALQALAGEVDQRLREAHGLLDKAIGAEDASAAIDRERAAFEKRLAELHGAWAGALVESREEAAQKLAALFSNASGIETRAIERIAEAERRTDLAIEAGVRRLTEAVEQAQATQHDVSAPITQSLERIERRFSDMQEQFERRLNGLEQTIGERIARVERETIDRIETRLGDSLERLSEASGHAEATARKIDQEASRALDRVAETAASLSAERKRSLEAMSAALRESESRLAFAEEESRKRIADTARSGASEAVRAVEQLEASLARVESAERRAAEGLGQTLRNIVSRVEAVASEAEKRLGQLEAGATKRIDESMNRLSAEAGEALGSVITSTTKLRDAERQATDAIAGAIEAAEARIDSAADHAAADVGSRLDKALADSAALLAAAESRVADAQRRLQDIHREGASVQDEARSRLRATLEEGITEAARAAERTFDAVGAAEKAEAAARRAQDDALRAGELLAARLDKAIAERTGGAAEALAARIDEQIQALITEYEQRAVSARALADAAAADADQAADNLRAAVTEIERRASECTVELERKADERQRRMELALKKADAIVGEQKPGMDPAPGTLADLVNRGEKVRTAAAASSAQLAALRSQTDVIRAGLASAVHEAANVLDRLQKKKDALAASCPASQTDAAPDADAAGAA